VRQAGGLSGIDQDIAAIVPCNYVPTFFAVVEFKVESVVDVMGAVARLLDRIAFSAVK
jgi:hypothetical protein